MHQLLRATAIFVLGLALIVSCTAEADQDSSAAKVNSLLNKGKYIPDIATFLQIGAATPAGYSWDGSDVYFTSGMSGANQVYRINDDGWPYQLSTFEDGIDFFVLSWGGTMGVVGASVGGSEQSDLYLMDTRTGRVVQLTKGQDVQYGSVVWARDDQSIFFRSNEENGQDFFLPLQRGKWSGLLSLPDGYRHGRLQ
jgi:hypothetical protein